MILLVISVKKNYKICHSRLSQKYSLMKRSIYSTGRNNDITLETLFILLTYLKMEMFYIIRLLEITKYTSRGNDALSQPFFSVGDHLACTREKP